MWRIPDGSAQNCGSCWSGLHPASGRVGRRLEAGMRSLVDKRMRLTGQNGVSDYDLGFTNFLYTFETSAIARAGPCASSCLRRGRPIPRKRTPVGLARPQSQNAILFGQELAEALRAAWTLMERTPTDLKVIVEQLRRWYYSQHPDGATGSSGSDSLTRSPGTSSSTMQSRSPGRHSKSSGRPSSRPKRNARYAPLALSLRPSSKKPPAPGRKPSAITNRSASNASSERPPSPTWSVCSGHRDRLWAN